jgi:hypothetical protein
MTRNRPVLFVLPFLVAIVSGICVAQPFRRGPRAMPETLSGDDRNGVPDWKVDEHFKHDVFTFVRVQYDSVWGGGRYPMYRQQSWDGMVQPFRRRGFGGGRRFWGGGWRTDWPDSDLNFSYRLQQLTSLKVNPNPISLRLTDPELFDYPFLYMIEPGALLFSDAEVKALRHYLDNGGFLMVDDFWGEYQWENFYREIRRVFPEQEFDPEELRLDHPIFQCVYQLKEKPQVPSIHAWPGPGSDVTWEDWGPGSREVHYKGISDKNGRLMVIICHNTDLGDGWEREGEDPSYFHEFSEKKSYPMGINIVTYAMTH